MTSLGKQTRLNRIFSHPSGRMLGIAVDHLITYPVGMPGGLRAIEQTVECIVEGAPSSITLNKGIAVRCMDRFAGRVPMIMQQMAITFDRPGFADHVTPAEAIALGADAIAVSILVRGDGEVANMRHLSKTVRKAERFGLPVMPHIYPVVERDGKSTVSHAPEDVFYAARIGVEMGADVVKVPFTGDAASYGDIVDATPIPVVAAGGPRCEDLEAAVSMTREVVRSGAAGAVVGRNVWGFHDVAGALSEFKQVMLP